jgi:alkylation response protein AidB-like acyl-CoA dehydrogenase
MDFIIPGDSAGVRIADLRAIEGEGQANVALQDVYVPQENVLLLDASTWREIANAGACLESAYLVGLAQRDFELTVNYAKQRKQFGSPIGSFQAVQHMCADSAVELDGMEMLMHEAAWAVRNGSPSRDLTVAMAKSWCSDASRRIVARGQQIHGAAGYSHESIIQLYFRHQRRPSFSWGSADYQRERIAALVGGLWSA